MKALVVHLDLVPKGPIAIDGPRPLKPLALGHTTWAGQSVRGGYTASGGLDGGGIVMVVVVEHEEGKRR